jgi:hypothetical protein
MVFLIDEVIMEKVFNTGVNPVHTGIYIVDRGEKLGTPLRWFNAETEQWSRCEYTMEDILQSKDKPGALGFLPWRGPVKVEKQEVKPLELVNAPAPAPMVVKNAKKPKAVKPLIVKTAKAVKVKTDKKVYADGTITFREDRQKYVAWYAGKQEAARPTLEGAKKFLFKKYNMADAQMLVLV